MEHGWRGWARWGVARRGVARHGELRMISLVWLIDFLMIGGTVLFLLDVVLWP